MINLENKIALVTGGGGGIGFEISNVLHKQGARVIITGRNRGKLLEASQTIGDRCSFYVCDHADMDQNLDLIQQIESASGPLDILVNNAGIHQKKPMSDVSDEEFDAILQTNLKAVFSLSREAGKKMMERRSGSIVMISSMASRYGIPKVISYTAAKSAIEGMTKAMAVEMGEFNVRVNCIAPGFIYSKMSAKALDDDPPRKLKVFGRTPLGRMGEASDIAHSVAFLVSDEANFITGVVLPVDGGNSIGF